MVYADTCSLSLSQLRTLARQTVSPTTHHGTKTPIAVAHSIETAIMYTTDTDGKRYELKIVDKPLVISSVGRSRSAPRIQVCPEQHVKADQIVGILYLAHFMDACLYGSPASYSSVAASLRTSNYPHIRAHPKRTRRYPRLST